jgi:hypothetical protein
MLLTTWLASGARGMTDEADKKLQEMIQSQDRFNATVATKIIDIERRLEYIDTLTKLSVESIGKITDMLNLMVKKCQKDT